MPEPGTWQAHIIGLAVALAIGFIVGTEREKRDSEVEHAHVAGVRTFSIVALIGGASVLLMPPWGTVVALLFVGGITTVSYFSDRRPDRGLTSEFALFAVALAGALAMIEPRVALPLGIVMAALLAFHETLHGFVRTKIRHTELLDMLTFALAAAVIWPMLPQHPVDPWRVLDPSKIWRLAVLVMGIQGAGHIARRVAGPRLGGVAAGFAGGFVSSSATIAAMAARVGRGREDDNPASYSAAAIASSIATFVELGLLIWMASPVLLQAMTPGFLAGGATMLLGTVVMVRSAPRRAAEDDPDGKAFSVRGALLFAVALTAVMVGVAALRTALGDTGAVATAALAGFADAHAVSASLASLHGGQTIPLDIAGLGVLLAFSTNTVTKCVIAWSSGSKRFRVQVIPIHLVALVITWALWLLV